MEDLEDGEEWFFVLTEDCSLASYHGKLRARWGMASLNALEVVQRDLTVIRATGVFERNFWLTALLLLLFFFFSLLFVCRK